MGDDNMGWLSYPASMKTLQSCRGTTDLKMVNRSLALLLVMAVVTALVKRTMIEKTGGQHTPEQAIKALQILQDPENDAILLDGFGRPFYPDSQNHILRSAGQDGRFQTRDDEVFLMWRGECPTTVKVWAKSALGANGWNFESLPQGWGFDATSFSLKGGPLTCPLPRLAGPDGIWKTGDDLFRNLQEVPIY